MNNFKIIPFLGIVFCMILVSFQSQSFAQSEEEKIFPDWVKLSTSIWVSGESSDAEFLALIENVLENKILPNEIESEEIMKDTAKIVIEDLPELYGKSTSELTPHWVKDRAEWWVEGKITDQQFLRTIHYLRETGYLEHTPEKSLFSNDETFENSLERFLLDNKEVLNITKETTWRIFSTEYELEEKEGIVDSVKIMFTDITRVYDPIFYKFKIPTLTMRISEFNDQNDLDTYWDSFEGTDKQKIFDSAYLTGNPNENSECMFNYTADGAITSCIYDNMIVQVIIFDQHGEHFDYDADELVLDKTEPTSRFLGEILKKISNEKNHSVNYPLHSVLQSNLLDELYGPSENNIALNPKPIDPETSITQGVRNFSCVRDDFGLVTISGQYRNDNIKRDQIDLVVSFLDNQGNTMGKTTAIFYDLQEFESKRFVGHSKWNENFSTCKITRMISQYE